MNVLDIPIREETPHRPWEQVRGFIPEGKTLNEQEWRARHHAVVNLIWIHALILAAFGLYKGFPVLESLGEGLVIAVIGMMASLRSISYRARSAIASLGLVTSAAVLIQFTNGYNEAHFYYFIVVIIIAMYEDWIPYLLAVLFIFLQHGLVGQLYPNYVYEHQYAIDHPWQLASIHAGLVFLASIILLIFWNLRERMRARTEMVLNSAGEGIIGLDLDRRITFANPSLARMTGYELKEMSGRRIDELLMFKDGMPPVCWFDPIFKSSDANACSCDSMVVVHRNGKTIPVDLVCNPISKYGVVTGSVVTIRDESVRRREKEALRQSEELMRQMAENIAEVFWMSSPEKNRMIYISPAYETIWNRTCKSLYDNPMSWMDSIYPEDRERIRTAALEKQAAGNYDEEYRIVRGDGTIRWIRDRAFPIRDESGKIYRIVGVAMDITDKRLAEEEIREANKQLDEINADLEERVKMRTLELAEVLADVRNEKLKTERIIHEITDGIIVMDMEGGILLINAAAKRFLGINGEETPKNISEIESQLPQMHEILQNVGQPLTEEIEIQASGRASPRVLKTTSVPLKDEKSKLLGKVAVLHDITSMKEVDRLKSQFISQVSHELRTPLTSIKGSIDNLRDDIAGPLSKKQAEYLLRMSKSADELVHLINDLLESSTLEAGKIALREETVVLHDLIEKIISRFQPIADKKGIVLRLVKYDGNSRVVGDQAKLEQAISHLLDNAIKYTEQGGEITISQHQKGRFLKTSIRDTGIGIPLDEQLAIFDRFYRVARGSSLEKGAGLGLYIAKNIIDMHKGRIRVSSELGRGSEFSFTFPLKNTD